MKNRSSNKFVIIIVIAFTIVLNIKSQNIKSSTKYIDFGTSKFKSNNQSILPIFTSQGEYDITVNKIYTLKDIFKLEFTKLPFKLLKNSQNELIITVTDNTIKKGTLSDYLVIETDNDLTQIPISSNIIDNKNELFKHLPVSKTGDLFESISFEIFPNPFYDEATITYSLDYQQEVSIALYNKNGNVVFDIIDDILDSGTHTHYIDGEDLEVGVYYCIVKIGNISKSTRLIKRK